MKCNNCKEEKPKKVYIAGKDVMTGKVVACNKCSKKVEDKDL